MQWLHKDFISFQKLFRLCWVITTKFGESITFPLRKETTLISSKPILGLLRGTFGESALKIELSNDPGNLKNHFQHLVLLSICNHFFVLFQLIPFGLSGGIRLQENLQDQKLGGNT